MSARSNTSRGTSPRWRAPDARNCASSTPMPLPAPVSMSTSWPAATSSRTPAGTSPTRYSWTLISRGTPTRMGPLLRGYVACEIRFPPGVAACVLAPPACRCGRICRYRASYRGNFAPMELDRYDRAIVRLLQQDARITNTALAGKVSLSESACLRRVRALEESRTDRGLHRAHRPAQGRFSGERVRQHHARPAEPGRPRGVRERGAAGPRSDGVLPHDRRARLPAAAGGQRIWRTSSACTTST